MHVQRKRVPNLCSSALSVCVHVCSSAVFLASTTYQYDHVVGNQTLGALGSGITHPELTQASGLRESRDRAMHRVYISQ